MMGKQIPECELWREEGSGAGSGNTWDDVLTLGRRADGSFRLSLRRYPTDYYEFDDRIAGAFTVYRSMSFRKPERLIDLLETAPAAAKGDWPTLNLSEILHVLVQLIDFDPKFAKEALRAFAQRLVQNA